MNGAYTEMGHATMIEACTSLKGCRLGPLMRVRGIEWDQRGEGATTLQKLGVQIEGEARERAGVWRRGLGEPSPDFFGILSFKSCNLVYSWKVYLEIIHFIDM